MNKTTLAYFTIEDNYFVFTRTNYFDDNTKSIERAKAEKELARKYKADYERRYGNEQL